VVEAGLGTDVPWTKPSDLPFNANNPFSALGELGPNFLAAFADGSVRMQLASTMASQLAAYITHRGGEDIANPPVIPQAPAVFVWQSAGDTEMNEFGVDWFDAVLDTAPAGNVTVNLSVSDAAVAKLDKASLVFTSTTWNKPQRVALWAVDDGAFNADRLVDIMVAAPGYAATQMFSATIRNDDPQPLAGDFNDDERVDGGDFLAWQRGWDSAWPAARAAGDADLDADVDAADLAAWRAQFGAVGGPAAANFDDDGHIGGQDLAAWRGGFGTAERAPLEHGDADADGDVDGRDFLAWQRTFGSASSINAVPIGRRPPRRRQVATASRCRCWQGCRSWAATTGAMRSPRVMLR
jgi:hypothetical protein